MLAFYKKIGFKTYVKEDNPPIVFFDNQGSKLELYPIEKLAEDINAENPPMINQNGSCGITLACNMKSEKEVDDLFAIIEKCGSTIAPKTEKVFWGGYSGYFQDLDGYYWEVAYASIWEFDEKDILIIKE